MILTGASGVDPVTAVTGGALAVAAIASSVTPVLLARRRAHADELSAAKTSAADKADLTLASWTALNLALQMEITRLQGVVEKLLARTDGMAAEIDSLRATIRALQEGKPRA